MLTSQRCRCTALHRIITVVVPNKNVGGLCPETETLRLNANPVYSPNEEPGSKFA